MKSRKIMKNVMPVITTGIMTGIGSRIAEDVMPAGAGKNATQNILGVMTPIAGIKAISSMTKEFDKFGKTRRRKYR
jgi:hypothetical protein